MVTKRIPGLLPVLLGVALSSSHTASGDQFVFVLGHGGRVVGELLNPDQVPRENYVVKTAEGAEIVLDRGQVAEQIYERPEKTEYRRICPQYADTVEAQWELAEWCRQRSLFTERERHLERILELDEDHEAARRALGYGRFDGEWKTQEQFMQEQGFVWFERKWRYPQEVKLILEQREKADAENEWKRKINLWQRWLDEDKSRIAVENFRAIDDPYAVKSLAEALKEEPNEQRRLLFINTLGRIGSPAAVKVLAVWSLADPLEEVMLTCIDHLKERESHVAVEYYISQLRSKDNTEINRAARALRHMECPAAIPPLIDALVTAHKFKITTGNPGQMSTTFGGGSGAPGGLSVGGSTKVLTRHIQNRDVLDALVALSGGRNFAFDMARWKAWYATQQRSGNLDARRS